MYSKMIVHSMNFIHIATKTSTKCFHNGLPNISSQSFESAYIYPMVTSTQVAKVCSILTVQFLDSRTVYLSSPPSIFIPSERLVEFLFSFVNFNVERPWDCLVAWFSMFSHFLDTWENVTAWLEYSESCILRWSSNFITSVFSINLSNFDFRKSIQVTNELLWDLEDILIISRISEHSIECLNQGRISEKVGRRLFLTTETMILRYN